MLRCVTFLCFMVLLGMLVACAGEIESTSTAIPTQLPTATRLPSVRRDPHETPIPQLATRSALADIRERGEMRVGILYNYLPFGFLADNGQVQGYEADLIRHIATRWGVEITFVQVTRQTRLLLLYNGEVDLLAAAMPHRRELEQFVEFSNTTFRSGYVAVVKSDFGIDNIAALNNSTIAIVGEEAQAAFTSYTAQLNIAPSIQVFDTVDDAVSALTQLNSVQAIVGRRENMMLVATSVEGLEIVNEFVLIEPYAFAVRRGDTPLRDLLNLTLQGIIADGEIGEVFAANFFGYSADHFPTLPGEPIYTFETFPVDIPTSEMTMERIRQGEPLHVAGLDLTTQPVPFDSRTIVDGYNRALVNEMARRWNVPVVESPQSVGEVGLNLLRSGQADLVVGIRPDRSLIGQVAFSQPYYQRGIRLIHMADAPVLGINDLEFRAAIAITPLDVSQDIIQDNNDFPDVRVMESLEEAYKALLARSVYAIVGDEYALMLMAQADSRIKVYDARYRLTDYVMALSPYDPDFLTLVNFTLQDMKADGTLDTLRQQYFGPYVLESEILEPFPMEVWPGDGSFLGIGGARRSEWSQFLLAVLRNSSSHPLL